MTRESPSMGSRDGRNGVDVPLLDGKGNPNPGGDDEAGVVAVVVVVVVAVVVAVDVAVDVDVAVAVAVDGWMDRCLVVGSDGFQRGRVEPSRVRIRRRRRTRWAQKKGIKSGRD